MLDKKLLKENKLATVVASVSIVVIVFSVLFITFYSDAPSKMEFGSIIMKSEYKDMTTDDGRDGEFSTNLFDDYDIKAKVDTTAEITADSVEVTDSESPSEILPESSASETVEGESHPTETANPPAPADNN